MQIGLHNRVVNRKCDTAYCILCTLDRQRKRTKTQVGFKIKF